MMNARSGCLAVVLAVLLAIAAGPTALTAQHGGIKWSGIDAPKTLLIQTSVNSFVLYVPGWITRSSSGTVMNDIVGTGFGTLGHSVKQVDKSEFEREETGAPMEASPLFPLVKDAVTGSAFAALHGKNYTWFGFAATAAGIVPGYHPGTVVFTFDNITRGDMIAALANAAIGVAKLDAKHQILESKIIDLPAITEPDVLYYKFDRGHGSVALNFVQDYAGAARTGSMTNPGSAWAATNFGHSLAGGSASNHFACDTTWTGGVRGSLTVAWFMRRRVDPQGADSTMFSRSGSICCATSGAAGLRLKRWSGTAADLRLNRDVQRMAIGNWVHIGLVIDGNRNTAVWYVDGRPEPTIANVPVAAIPAGTPLLIGGTPSAPNYYDIDEFRLRAGAATAAEIHAWQRGPVAAGTRHGIPGGCALLQRGAPPRSGATYEIWGTGPANTRYALILGPPLVGGPVRLLNQDLWTNPLVVTTLGVTDNNNWIKVQTQIPSGISRTLLYMQGFMPLASGVAVSNVLAAAIE